MEGKFNRRTLVKGLGAGVDVVALGSALATFVWLALGERTTLSTIAMILYPLLVPALLVYLLLGWALSGLLVAFELSGVPDEGSLVVELYDEPDAEGLVGELERLDQHSRVAGLAIGGHGNRHAAGDVGS